MGGKHLAQIAPHINLYRDPATGIAWVADGRAGVAHTCHPNISERGSVTGMRAKGWWKKSDRLVRSLGFIYNVEEVVAHDPLDRIAARFCECQACLERKIKAGNLDEAKALDACRQLVHAYKKGAAVDEVEWEDVDPAAGIAAEALGETLDAYPEEESELEKEGVGI